MEAPVFAEIIFSASSAKILSFPPFDCTGVSEKELVGGGGEDVAFTSAGWKLISLSHGQELGQIADLASDWMFTLVQQIRSPLAY